MDITENIKTRSLLLEIGTEEIPAGYIGPALKALSSTLLKRLEDVRIEHGKARTFGTPMRLAIQVMEVAEKQTSLSKEVTGPPEKVSFDEDGKPTMAAVKFAEKVGIPLKKIKIKETKKGAYLSADVTEKGIAAKKLLKNILPEVILSLPFPKTMRWSDLDISFARPIHSILALFGKDIISFPMGDLKSGRKTFGHRFMRPGKMVVSDIRTYCDSLREASVIADIEERKKRVLEEIEKVAKEFGGSVLPDEELVDIVTNLVELPFAIAGNFDDKFLELPEEVLITAMREHQKYFAVINKDGSLMPWFIAVNNTRAKDMDLVAKGHGRVLRARLEDAIFFFRNDIKESLENMSEKLKGVLFQAKLGSMHEKIVRVSEIGKYIATEMGGSEELAEDVQRAAQLCKADLVSQVVVEFPKLQGVMGRIYAAKDGETEQVSTAIEEHYRPVRSGGELPETDIGSVLSIADKMDSICGCFSAGFVPTGAADPYALRRQGIGIVQIMHNRKLKFSLSSLIEKSVSLFEKSDAERVSEISGDVYNFLSSRISHLMAEEGFSKDVISAVTSVSVDCLPDAWEKVKALEKLKNEPDFEPLAISFKRVANIIKKAKGYSAGRVDKTLFQEESEENLYSDLEDVTRHVSENLESGHFSQALYDIASLKNSVDTFFDDVLVMDDNIKIRNNRLSLLGEVASLFENIADFSMIST